MVNKIRFVGNLDVSQAITVHVYDRDVIGSDFLGTAKISLAQMINTQGNEVEDWYPLEDEPTKTYNVGTQLPGKIKIKMHFPKVNHTPFKFNYM